MTLENKVLDGVCLNRMSSTLQEFFDYFKIFQSIVALGSDLPISSQTRPPRVTDSSDNMFSGVESRCIMHVPRRLEYA